MMPLLLASASIAFGLVCVIKPASVGALVTAARSRVMGWVDPLGKEPLPRWVWRVLGIFALLLGCVFLVIAWLVLVVGVPAHG